MTTQYLHESIPFIEKKHPITLICDAITIPANIGGLYRICDAFGIDEIVFCGSTINFNSHRLKKTARNTINNTTTLFSEDITQTIREYKLKKYTICSLEITSKSIPIEVFKTTTNAKIAIVIGNENHGVSTVALNLTNYDLHIPMYGKNSSMNVVTAAAVALYQIISSHFES